MEEKRSKQDFDLARAEVFDAISHPARIRILESLSDRPMGFADLKRTIGIESSGHLEFHLAKLSRLIKKTSEGDYTLTDEGREALWSTSALRQPTKGTTSISHAAGARTYRTPIALFLAVLILLTSVAVYQQLVIGSQVAAVSNLEGQVSALSGAQQRLLANLTALQRENIILELRLFAIAHLTTEEQSQLTSFNAQILSLESQLGTQNATSIRAISSFFSTDGGGAVPLFPFGLNDTSFHKVSLVVYQWSTNFQDVTVNVVMGKSVQTAPAPVTGSFPLGISNYTASTTPQVHTYDLSGPEFGLLLTGGPAYSLIGIQVWILFH